MPNLEYAFQIQPVERCARLRTAGVHWSLALDCLFGEIVIGAIRITI